MPGFRVRGIVIHRAIICEYFHVILLSIDPILRVRIMKVSLVYFDLLRYSSNSRLRDLKLDSAGSAPCAKHYTHSAIPSDDVSVLTHLIRFLLIDGLLEQGYACGELICPGKTKTRCLQVDNIRIVTPTCEESLLVVKCKRIICRQNLLPRRRLRHVLRKRPNGPHTQRLRRRTRSRALAQSIDLTRLLSRCGKAICYLVRHHHCDIVLSCNIAE